MEHAILVKWNDTVTDKAAIQQPIGALFAAAAQLPGVTAVRLVPGLPTRPNRYDLAIVLTMTPEGLEAFDRSDLHRVWKETYTDKMQSKAIFDWEL